MKYFIATLACLTLGAFLAFADWQSEFATANQLYRTSEFQNSFDRYDKLSHEIASADIFYNLGNSAFKLNRLGLAILNYKRALQLNPRDSDVVQN